MATQLSIALAGGFGATALAASLPSPETYPDAPLTEIVSAIAADDASALDRLIVHFQRAEGLTTITSSELLELTQGCSFDRDLRGDTGLSSIWLSCPDRTPSNQCDTGRLVLTVLAEHDGTFKIEIDEEKDISKDGCGIIPPSAGLN